MENSVLKRTFTLFAVMSFTAFIYPMQVYADLAPIPDEPEKASFNFLPVVLAVIVVIIAVFLLSKLKKKN